MPAAEAVTITRSLPHGHVAAVHAIAVKLGLPALLGPAGPQRDLALALVISRVVAPASKLSTLTWWDDTTLGTGLGVTNASTDDIYAAMDWLASRQDAIEKQLAGRHLGPEANPARMALFDLSSSWLEGTHCPLAARGYSRDGKKGLLQIEYGLLTDPACRPATFTGIIQVVREKFALARMVMVGDRGMITSARIEALNAAEDGTEPPGGTYGWITALRAPAIKKLMAEDGPLQLSLFDQQDLAEITSEDYPGERLVACRNPVLAAERARKREDLLAATEKLLDPLIARVQAGRLAGAAKIGVEVSKVISKYKTAKHFDVTIIDVTGRTPHSSGPLGTALRGQTALNSARVHEPGQRGALFTWRAPTIELRQAIDPLVRSSHDTTRGRGPARRRVPSRPCRDRHRAGAHPPQARSTAAHATSRFTWASARSSANREASTCAGRAQARSTAAHATSRFTCASARRSANLVSLGACRADTTLA